MSAEARQLPEFDPEDPEHKQRLAELARSDRKTAYLYEVLYEHTYGEEVPQS